MNSLKIGDGTVSVDYSHYDHEGRDVYKWTVVIPAGEFSGTDLRSGCQGASERDMYASLLSFLGACGESVAYGERTGRAGENADLFPPAVAEWARENRDEIATAECDLEESEETECECGEPLDRDCAGNMRCPVCDEPCPMCSDGN